MDLSLTSDQQALSDLAARILGDHATPEALTAVEDDPDGVDRAAWRALAAADILGLCLPTDVGGGGYGVLEASLLCLEVGRSAARVPVLATLMLGALPIARHGPAALSARQLAPVARGDAILTAALTEPHSALAPTVPVTTATPAGARRWTLRGVKTMVPVAHVATGVLVPAATGAGKSTVFVVDPGGPGVTLDRQVATDGTVSATLTFDGFAVGADDVVGTVDGGAEVTATIVETGLAGLCAQQAGTCAAALALAATYTSGRKQFGAPIASFQAVAHRLADAYVDTEAIRLTALQAAWRLAAGLPATEALAVAKVWAAEGGQRVVHAAQHVHGGIGVDTDYPLHRFFRAAKAAEVALGGTAAHLTRLGALIADESGGSDAPSGLL